MSYNIPPSPIVINTADSLAPMNYAFLQQGPVMILKLEFRARLCAMTSSLVTLATAAAKYTFLMLEWGERYL